MRHVRQMVFWVFFFFSIFLFYNFITSHTTITAIFFSDVVSGGQAGVCVYSDSLTVFPFSLRTPPSVVVDAKTPLK